MQRKEGNRREIWVNEKGKWRGGEEHYEVEEKGSRVYKRQRQQRKKNKRFINNDKVQNLNQIKLRWES